MKRGFTSAFAAIFAALSFLFQYVLGAAHMLFIYSLVITGRRNAFALPDLQTFFVAPIQTNKLKP